MKVFVNPGHDPNVDSGAINSDYDVCEADVTKKAGALLERGLKRAGHEVMVLQSDELSAVVAAANDWPADIFVSLHCNASPNHNARGTETLYYSEQGRLLGEEQGTDDRPWLQRAPGFICFKTHCDACNFGGAGFY